jgi:hypothetical protein
MFNSEDEFKNIVDKLNIDDKPNESHKQNLRRQMLSVFEKSTTHTAGRWQTFGRIIMKSKITKLAAAAVIIIAALLILSHWDKSVTSAAYALEQTIEANLGVHYLHIKYFDVSHEEPREIWLEYAGNGKVKNIRAHMPEWTSPGDGPHIVVWKENKMQIWFEDKNVLKILKDFNFSERFNILAEEADPRLAVERFYELRKQKQVEMKITQPSDKAEPIIVTATYLPGSPHAGCRWTLFVDQATKLVTSVEIYRMKNGKYEYQGLLEYYDYNQPIENKMFSIEDEVPADVIRFDTTTQDIGLAQEQLSDEQIAVEVAHKFIKALIAEDYSEAGRLVERGIPADWMQKQFNYIKYLRILSIGQAAPYPNSKTKTLVVPCMVEVEKDGQVIQLKLNLKVRQIFNRPGRWTIFGGIY